MNDSIDDETLTEEKPKRRFFGRRKDVAEPIEDIDEDEDSEEDWDDDWDDEPDRKRRSRAAHRPSIIFLNFLVTCGVLGTIGLVALGFEAKNRFEAPGPLTEDTSFVVREGATMTSVSRELAAAGLIDSEGLFGVVDGPRLFTQAARLSGNDRAIKTGEFAIPAGASMSAVLDELTDGSPIEYRVTIPEGLTVYQAAQRIASHPDLTGDLPDPLPPEGSLAAETVSFARGETRASVIERLQRIQAERVEAVWNERSSDLPLENPEELLILASIVEKETGLAAERPQVAAVFVNRIRENWHLNTDPSVVYGVFGGEGLPSGRPITKADLRDRNPYNTYIFRGLPPGPIAIPGRAALEAAANPDEHAYMYFVADGTGGHAFAETAEEHNRNVQQWRRIERGEIEPPSKPGTPIANGAAEEEVETANVSGLVDEAIRPEPLAEELTKTPIRSVVGADAQESTDVALTEPSAETEPAGDIPIPLTRPE